MRNNISITEFGAVPNGELQTDAIQRAVDRVHAMGGGTVTVPEGVYLTGGVTLRSNVTLRLLRGAVLAGSRDITAYMSLDNTLGRNTDYDLEAGGGSAEPVEPHTGAGRWNNCILKAVEAENIAIIGEDGSKIDGQNCYDPLGEEDYRGPHAIGFYHCRNITLRGYEIVNSSNWAHIIYNSVNITAEGLRVFDGHDGFHIRVCDNVLVKNCLFETGDDSIAGFANQNVVIEDCEINSSCNGMRFGGTNILVERCHFYGPGRGARRYVLSDADKIAGVNRAPEETGWVRMLSAFDYFGVPTGPEIAEPGHIVIRNCKVENVERFFQYNFSGNDVWQSGTPLRDIHFENVDASGISHPIVAYGDAEKPVTVTMENVSFRFAEGSEQVNFLQACNFKLIRLKNVTVGNTKCRPLIKTWSDGEIVMENVVADIPESERVGKASKPFSSDRI